jgi:hypothetical protein
MVDLDERGMNAFWEPGIYSMVSAMNSLLIRCGLAYVESSVRRVSEERGPTAPEATDSRLVIADVHDRLRVAGGGSERDRTIPARNR